MIGYLCEFSTTQRVQLLQDVILQKQTRFLYCQ